MQNHFNKRQILWYNFDMKQLSFDRLHLNRKKIIYTHKDQDHIVINGNNNILLSAPHGVSQIRLGKYKSREIGSLATALHLKNNSNCYLIAKTKNNNDDANFDEISQYKSSIEKLIKTNDIKYLIDLHGLSSNRDCDINLGIHLGKNIETNISVFNWLNNQLTNNGFLVKIDEPFMAGIRTISGYFKNKHPNIWTLQIEINCSITNKKENFSKFKTLLNILTEWINNLK